MDVGDPSSEELNAERYADLDLSKEGELSHIAGWFVPPEAEEEKGTHEQIA